LDDPVLVTGATGFIGHHVVQTLLEQGEPVRCLVRPTSDLRTLPTERLSLAYGDITEPEGLATTVAGVKVVYHLAASLTARSAQAFHSVNEIGTRNLAEACARSGSTPVLVVLSSLAAAGPNPADRPRREGEPPAPVSHYGKSKLAGERAARAFSDRIPVTVVRAPIVFGERDRDVFKMFRLVRLGVHLIPVAPSQRYSLIHAADLAGLLARAAAGGERCRSDSESEGLYYVGYPEALTYPELGSQLAQALGRPRVVSLPVPKPIVWAAAAAFEAGSRLIGRRPSIINLDKAREAFAGSWSCSPTKAEQQVAFRPALPLSTRLKQTADWYRAEGWL
jgi:nucleoside-diphosphate-sugar epimerase